MVTRNDDNMGQGLIPTPPKRELVLEGDPEKQLEFAKKAANALMKVVKPVKIGGKDYLQFGGWQTLARFFGATVGVEWTKPILDKDNKVVGFEARAEVLQRGEKISSAEASCLRSERNWNTREEFALKSMAQTRASAKALRNAFGWVAELAGLESTPAEEMSYDTTPIKEDAIPVVHMDDHEAPPSTPLWDAQKLEAVTKRGVQAQKKRIKELVDKKVIAPVTTKEEYETYVADNTGLDLKDPNNFQHIIEKLEAL